MKVTILYNPVWIYCIIAFGVQFVSLPYLGEITHIAPICFCNNTSGSSSGNLAGTRRAIIKTMKTLFSPSTALSGQQNPCRNDGSLRKMIYRLNTTINSLCNHNGRWLLWSNLPSYGDDEPPVYVFGGYGEVGSGSMQMPVSLYAATPAKRFHFCSSLISSGFFSGFVLQLTRNKKKRKAIEEGKGEAS